MAEAEEAAPPPMTKKEEEADAKKARVPLPPDLRMSC